LETSNIEVKCGKKDYLEKNMISALIYLFSRKEINEIRCTTNSSTLEQTNVSRANVMHRTLE